MLNNKRAKYIQSKKTEKKRRETRPGRLRITSLITSMDSKGTSRLLLSLLLFSSLIFPTTFSRSLFSTPPNPVSDKVSVELYYETLCPDSVDFILNHLVKLFHTGLISIVDLKLLPYGNAKLRSNSTIICQVNSISNSKSKSGCLFYCV